MSSGISAPKSLERRMEIQEGEVQAFKERVIMEGPWEEGGDADNIRVNMTTCIRKVASEEFRVSRGSRSEAKDIWWWNDDVPKDIKEKKDCFRRLHLDRSADNIDRYKVPKKAAKRVVSEARGWAYKDLCQGERDIYKMAKIRERKRGMSTKSNALRTERIGFWWSTRRLSIDGRSTWTSCSMEIILNWTTPLMIPADALCAESRSLGTTRYKGSRRMTNICCSLTWRRSTIR
jgi:hypothetical protein